MSIADPGNTLFADSPSKRAGTLWRVITAVIRGNGHDGEASPAERLNMALFVLEVAWHEGATLTTRVQQPAGPGRSFYQLEPSRAKEALDHARERQEERSWLDDLAAASDHPKEELLAGATQLAEGTWPPGNLIDQHLQKSDLFATILIRVALEKLGTRIDASVDSHGYYWADSWKRVFHDENDRAKQIARFVAESRTVRALVGQAVLDVLAAEDVASTELDSCGVAVAPTPTSDELGLLVDEFASLEDAATMQFGLEAAPSSAPARAPRAAAPAPLRASPHGLTRVPAEKFKDGFNNFMLRSDLAEFYLAAYRRIHALGGIVTSIGSMRSFEAEKTQDRSPTSLHYTGRSLDLYTRSGMLGPADRYLVARDGGSDERPEWKVYCASVDPREDDPDFDASLLQEGELEYAIWKAGTGVTTARRTLRYFCLTDVFASHGWVRIPSRAQWKTRYLSTEWWHFQHHLGLVTDVTRFGDELKKIWPADAVARSGLRLDSVWRGRGFA